MWFAGLHTTLSTSLTLSMPWAMINICKAFANSIDHNEPSHQDICCLTFSLAALHINFFSIDRFIKNKADGKCSLKFGAERVN